MKKMTINKQFLETQYFNLGVDFILIVIYKKIDNELHEEYYIQHVDYGVISFCFGCFQSINKPIRKQLEEMKLRINKDVSVWSNYINEYTEKYIY